MCTRVLATIDLPFLDERAVLAAEKDVQNAAFLERVKTATLEVKLDACRSATVPCLPLLKEQILCANAVLFEKGM
jgi:hypothetical protein